ncbi:hypothetical protein ACFQRB_14480 [Halobaculum litoreum]|uniref:Carboxypeptidase regulatory-like domain-containing protein n=1 Tax=Halobaculum litoreum TaxID=3031998 RepID=A0ABD5XUJ6_9EURY
MTNPNDVPVVAVVEGPNDTVERVALDPAGEANDSRRLVGLENGSYTVRTLTADGREREVGRERLAVDCPAAGDGPGLGPVETTVACDVDGDGGVLVVANPNDVPVQVVVVGPNDTDERATLGPAGEDDDRLRLDGLVNGTYTVRTLTAEDENGTEVGVEAVAVDCAPTAPDEPDEPDEPAPPVNLRPVGATADCDDDGGVLVVTNPNEVAVQVGVEGPGDTEERVTLDPAGEEDDELALDTLENGTYTVRTLTGEDENVTEVGVDTVEIACEADAGVDSDEGETGLEPADGESENGTAPPTATTNRTRGTRPTTANRRRPTATTPRTRTATTARRVTTATMRTARRVTTATMRTARRRTERRRTVRRRTVRRVTTARRRTARMKTAGTTRRTVRRRTAKRKTRTTRTKRARTGATRRTTAGSPRNDRGGPSGTHV